MWLLAVLIAPLPAQVSTLAQAEAAVSRVEAGLRGSAERLAAAWADELAPVCRGGDWLAEQRLEHFGDLDREAHVAASVRGQTTVQQIHLQHQVEAAEQQYTSASALKQSTTAALQAEYDAAIDTLRAVEEIADLIRNESSGSAVLGEVVYVVEGLSDSTRQQAAALATKLAAKGRQYDSVMTAAGREVRTLQEAYVEQHGRAVAAEEKLTALRAEQGLLGRLGAQQEAVVAQRRAACHRAEAGEQAFGRAAGWAAAQAAAATAAMAAVRDAIGGNATRITTTRNYRKLDTRIDVPEQGTVSRSTATRTYRELDPAMVAVRVSRLLAATSRGRQPVAGTKVAATAVAALAREPRWTAEEARALVGFAAELRARSPAEDLRMLSQLERSLDNGTDGAALDECGQRRARAAAAQTEAREEVLRLQARNATLAAAVALADAQLALLQPVLGRAENESAAAEAAFERFGTAAADGLAAVVAAVAELTDVAVFCADYQNSPNLSWTEVVYAQEPGNCTSPSGAAAPNRTSAAADPASCAALCTADPTCTAYEHHAAAGRCVVHTAPAVAGGVDGGGACFVKNATAGRVDASGLPALVATLQEQVGSLESETAERSLARTDAVQAWRLLDRNVTDARRAVLAETTSARAANATAASAVATELAAARARLDEARGATDAVLNCSEQAAGSSLHAVERRIVRVARAALRR